MGEFFLWLGLRITIKLRCVTHLYGWIFYGAFTEAQIEANTVDC